MRVSLSMIVRNEAANLAACLSSVRDLVAEMIVVDTGSTDETITIAERMGARVHTFPWVDNFSAARNEALRHAGGDWIFILDADERLADEDRARLRALFGSLGEKNAGYLMQQVCLAADGGVAIEVEQVRLFPNRSDIRWRYRVHEQIIPSIDRAGGTLEKTGVRIEHAGFAHPTMMAAKLMRNLRLVELDCEERPLDPFPMFCKGRMLGDLGRSAEAIVALELCRSLPDARIAPRSELARQIQMMLARCYRREDQIPEALEEIRGARALLPQEAEALCLEAEILIEAGNLDAAASCILGAQTDRGDIASFQLRARSLLGEIWINLERYEAAEAEVLPLTRDRPGYAPPWFTLADALLGQGRVGELRAIEAHFASFDGADSAVAVIRSARLVYEGNEQTARAAIDDAIRKDPTSRLLVPFQQRLETTSDRALPLASCLRPPWLARSS